MQPVMVQDHLEKLFKAENKLLSLMFGKFEKDGDSV